MKKDLFAFFTIRGATSNSLLKILQFGADSTPLRCWWEQQSVFKCQSLEWTIGTRHLISNIWCGCLQGKGNKQPKLSDHSKGNCWWAGAGAWISQSVWPPECTWQVMKLWKCYFIFLALIFALLLYFLFFLHPDAWWALLLMRDLKKYHSSKAASFKRTRPGQSQLTTDLEICLEPQCSRETHSLGSIQKHVGTRRPEINKGVLFSVF